MSVITYPKKTAYMLVREAAKAYPNLIAYRFMGKKTTYQTMLRRIESAAAGLSAMGIGKGDRVTLCLPNCPQAVESFYALNMLGAVSNIIHPLCAVEELRFYLEKSGSKAIVTLPQLYDKVLAARYTGRIFVASVGKALPFYKRPFYQEEKLPRGGYTPWEQVYAHAPLQTCETDSSACACILYSGGTTGKPKGVCLSSDNLNAAALQTLEASGYQDFRGTKMLAILPMFHGFGLGVGIHTPLVAGAGCILVPRFKLNTYVRILKREKPQFIPGVPALFEALLQAKGLENTDLSYLKGIFCGGDSLSPDLKKRMDAFLRRHGCTEQIREGYGMTESVSVSSLTPRHTAKEGTIGLPFPDTLYKIVIPGTTCPAEKGQTGEICISGPTVMMGYLDDPQETAQTLQRHADGVIWLHTGDLGVIEPDGYVRFVQRLKRMIVTNGYNVYPSAIEEILLKHPKVENCCVVGVKNVQRGQKVKAFIVPKTAGDEALEKELLAYCADHIARYAMPRQMVFCKDLPKTPLNKVDYKKLEDT